MKISLIICTYMRAEPLRKLLESVRVQTVYPYEILIIDGSRDEQTQAMIAASHYKALQYFKVSDSDRGLTRQRNFGIKKVAADADVVAFLDDDTILTDNYFENLASVYQRRPDAAGVGGIAINENRWQAAGHEVVSGTSHYVLDGYVIAESDRNKLRRVLGLASDSAPQIMPEFSHGRSYSYPMTGNEYPVDLLVGMSMSFRRSVFEHIHFSTYFEGYGLYEDADFSIRALAFGQNYIATSVQLSHFHDASGRPAKFRYGKMVVRNGWFVWRVKYPNPSLKARFKWHSITLLLAFIRLGNSLSGNEKKQTFMEAAGRFSAWARLFFDKPQVKS